MYCRYCGKKISDDAVFCSECGKKVNENFSNQQNQKVEKHEFPKCTCCGHIGNWKVEPLVRPVDWILTVFLLFFFGSGLIYLLVIVAIRSDENKRAKICSQCGARNLFTYLY